MANTRTFVSSEPIEKECETCGAKYMAAKVVNKDETGKEFTTITPRRCETCQTNHLTNLRVDKCLTAMKHIGNLKLRLSVEQREVIIAAMTDGLNTVYERFQGTTTVKSGFDIAKI